MVKFYSFFLFICLLFSTIVSAQTQTAKDLFDQGIGFLKLQKYSEALDAFQKSARIDPKNAAAHGNIGASLMALQRPAEAVASFREAVKIAPNEGKFHTALCESLSRTKNHSEAILQCEEGVRLSANAPEAYVVLIAALRSAKRGSDAAQKTEIALQKFADNESLLNISAEAFADAGNFQRTLEIYENLARSKPNSPYYQVKLAENYLRFERDAEAIAAARKALESDPKHPLAHFFIGKLYFELGQNEEATQAFQKSAEIDPKFADAFYFMGVSEKRCGKMTEAVNAFRQAIALTPENAEYQKQLGIALNDSAKYEEAIAPLRLAVKLAPDDFETKAALGVALSESANFEESLQVLAEADRMKPGNQLVQMFMNVDRSRQQMSVQIPEMIAFAKENPQDLNVRLHLVQLLTYTRRLKEAEPYFTEIWKMNPPDVRVYDMIGTLHSTTGNYEKAAEAYSKAIEIGQSPAGYLGLTIVYAKNNQVNEAIAAYEKVLEVKPDSPNIMKLYADYLRDNGKRREALNMYKRSLSMLPNNAPAIFNAGILSAKLGDLDSAKQYLAMLKTLEPQSAKILSRAIRFRW